MSSALLLPRKAHRLSCETDHRCQARPWRSPADLRMSLRLRLILDGLPGGSPAIAVVGVTAE
jgi:hypothetical protein